MNAIIKNFLKIFGEDATTNFDLIKYAKILNLKNVHVVMTDGNSRFTRRQFFCNSKLSVNITRGYPLGSII